jgi:hypothetical protein
MIFSVLTPSSLVDTYQCWRETCYLHLQGTADQSFTLEVQTGGSYETVTIYQTVWCHKPESYTENY